MNKALFASSWPWSDYLLIPMRDLEENSGSRVVMAEQNWLAVRELKIVQVHECIIHF
jgi:hypothetical protein